MRDSNQRCPGASLANPDNYTDLFDNGGPITINPFKAYAKLVLDRKFSPFESYVEPYLLYLEKIGKVNVLDFAVDASWPGRAKEPYQIDAPIVGGEIDDDGANIVPITVDVFHANNDVSEVWFDFSSMGFENELALTFVSGNTWQLSFQNTEQASAGVYLCIVRAKSSSSNRNLYGYFNLTVTPGAAGVSLATDVQPIFDSYCISCHGDGGSAGLDLRPAQAGEIW